MNSHTITSLKSDLSEEEVKLYDRQIRLWGIDAQRRMRAAEILLVGFKGLNAEICKNLVLAGVSKVTIVENEIAKPQDQGSNFFLEKMHIGQNRGYASIKNISLLNPLVKIHFEDNDIFDKGEQFFKQFVAVCATGCSLDYLLKLDDLCRKFSVYFFAADVFGHFGFFFSDLCYYEYSSSLESPVLKSLCFPSLHDAIQCPWFLIHRSPKLFFAIQILYQFQMKWHRFPSLKSVNCVYDTVQIVGNNDNDDDEEKEEEEEEEDLSKLRTLVDDILREKYVKDSTTWFDFDYLRLVASNVSIELPPVCAVVGGILSQEIIKVISRQEDPLQNFFFYDATSFRDPGETAFIPPLGFNFKDPLCCTSSTHSNEINPSISSLCEL